MADQEEPVAYFDRNEDARLQSLATDLRRDLEAIEHLRTAMPYLGVDTLDAIASAIRDNQIMTASRKETNRTRPVLLAPKLDRPDLVAWFGRRYDVEMDDRTLSDVELSYSASTWQYRSGRNVYLNPKRTVRIRERQDGAA